jgi:hypothetical protein
MNEKPNLKELSDGIQFFGKIIQDICLYAGVTRQFTDGEKRDVVLRQPRGESAPQGMEDGFQTTIAKGHH